MDAATHSMAGMLVASVWAVKIDKDRLYPLLLTGAIASVIPDLDAVTAWISPEFFFKYHRVFTHTVFAAPILAVIASVPAWAWMKAEYLRVYLLALAVIIIHLALDVLCVWPIMLFYPLSQNDYALNLFHGKDTSMVALIALTVSVMGMLYYHQRRWGRR